MAENAEFMLQLCQSALAAKGADPLDWMLCDVEKAQAKVDLAKRAIQDAL